MLSVAIICTLLVGCGQEEKSGTKMLSFSQAQSVGEIKKLDGNQVTIVGYMSTLSPVSGTFMYLMNLPYQSCPFCVPNTNQLSNTIAVYAKNSAGFELTDQAIQVIGTLEFGDYTDEFGYEYKYRIVDATYTILDTENMSDELRLWQQLAATNVVSDVYLMFEYLDFLCYWPVYTAQFENSTDYIYPDDALYFIETDNAQYNYGLKENYFENMIATIEDVNPTEFAELVQMIKDAKTLSEQAYNELKNKNYSQTEEYSAVFGDGRQQYKLNKSEELQSQMMEIYQRFSLWLSKWEL